VRNFHNILNDIPIRYFVPIGFLVAAGIAVLVYVFVALPAADEQAFAVTEQDFSSKVNTMRGRFNMLLSQGRQQAVSQDVFITASKPEVEGIAIITADGHVRYAGNTGYHGKSYSELPFVVDPAVLKRTLSTGQMMMVRNLKDKILTGYVGLGALENGVMTPQVLVIAQSTEGLSENIKRVAVRSMEILALALVLLAIAVAALLREKVTRRLNKLLAASKMLAAEEDDIGPLLQGGDEFGQISDQLKKTADILARKRTKLLEALDEAKAASVAKSEFLSNMSHEIRTPMNGVVSGLSLLQSSSDEAEKQELTSAALNSAHALMNIINDVLDFSKLEAGRLEISPGPFLLTRMLKDIQVLMRPLAAEKRTKLSLEVSEACDVNVVADEVRLRQVITNLVGNAVKFTEGGVIIIKAVLRGDDSKTLEVRVIDTGVGIPKDEIGLLFKRFSQLSNSRAQKVRGTGLGLAICRQIIELMGGKIGVDSIFGEGSCFWFRIPIDLVDSEISRVEQTNLEEPGYGLSILLAEDVYINQMLISKMLARLGHTVTLAENGQEALDILDEKPEGTFDLVLLDNQMPVMSGLEAAKRVRARGDSKGKTPIIALTADVLTEQREAFQNVGMNGFVSKPISIDKLRFEIDRAMQNKA